MEGFEAFARALGSEIAELRGCLIATRDGRVLGTYPTGSTVIDAAWRRIAPLRACTSAIVRFEGETWCIAAFGPFVAFGVVAASADPVPVVERMSTLLATARVGAVNDGPADVEAATIVLPKGAPADDRSADEHADEQEDVDRAALVQEFSRLLQEKRTAADG